MSYARISEGDIYLYLDVRGFYICCYCQIEPNDTGDWRGYNTLDTIVHVDAHSIRGDTIPDRCIPQLQADSHENDIWLGEFRMLDLRMQKVPTVKEERT